MADFDNSLPPQGIIKCDNCAVQSDDVLWDYKEGEWINPLCWECYQQRPDFDPDDYDEYDRSCE